MLEREFWSKVKDKLTKEGCFCTRIESGSTEVGIPDVFVQGRKGDVWLELKSEQNVHIKGKEKVKVHWRKGQLAWALVYNKIHQTKCTYTIARYEDGILIIPMTMKTIMLIKDNYIPLMCARVIALDEWKHIKLSELLIDL